MNCPVCPDVSLVMADRQGIEIDYCPKCRGVWLDRGELDKIIERSSRQEEPPAWSDPRTPRPYWDDDDHYKFKKFKKRKSLLSEIFDFD